MSRILIVGGGYIGLYAARHLERLLSDEHRVTLVSPENFMTYQPFLPEAVPARGGPRDVAQLGSLERPREPFRRAAGEEP